MCVTFSDNACDDKSVGIVERVQTGVSIVPNYKKSSNNNDANMHAQLIGSYPQSPCFHMNRTRYTEITINSAPLN